MPAPTRPQTRRYLKRNELQAALDASGIGTLSQLARLCGVHRVVMSRTANGRDPVSEALETKMRTELGVKLFDDVAWIETR